MPAARWVLKDQALCLRLLEALALLNLYSQSFRRQTRRYLIAFFSCSRCSPPTHLFYPFLYQVLPYIWIPEPLPWQCGSLPSRAVFEASQFCAWISPPHLQARSHPSFAASFLPVLSLCAFLELLYVLDWLLFYALHAAAYSLQSPHCGLWLETSFCVLRSRL